MKKYRAWVFARKAIFALELLGLVALTWSGAYWIFVKASGNALRVSDSGQLRVGDSGELVTVLFGASSIALFILSFLLAGLALIGWQSFKDFRERISKKVKGRTRELEEKLERRTRLLEDEMKGRIHTILGFAFGEMGLEAGTFSPADTDKLEEAVKQCRVGISYLEKVKGPAEYLGLNNLLFYSCVLFGGKANKDNEEYMLAGARRLKEAGEKYNVTMLKLTACRVFLEYGATPSERAQARESLKALLAMTSGVSEREKREALYYLNNYPPEPVKQST